jgi:integrase
VHPKARSSSPCARTGKRLRARSAFEAAAHIEQSSAHWLRHTASSHLSDAADLKVIRDNLGHANISTTSIYVHSEDDARHDARQLPIGWPGEKADRAPAHDGGRPLDAGFRVRNAPE